MDRLHKLNAHLMHQQRQPQQQQQQQLAAEPTAAQGGQDVLYEVLDGGVALVTLNRPKRLNALTAEMQAEYFDALDRADADDKVRVIVVTGAGRGFCAGAEMNVLKTLGSRKPGSDKPRRNIEQIQALAISKPIVAAINGPCAGLGFVLALMTDIRFTTDKAKFTSAFVKRGLIAEHGLSWVLPRVVGTSNSLDILMSSRVFLGDEAARMGLVTRSYPDADTLLRETLAYARSMARECSPAGLAEIKSQVYGDATTTLRQSSDNAQSLLKKALQHPDSKEGVASYLENRDPDFPGTAFRRIRDM